MTSVSSRLALVIVGPRDRKGGSGLRWAALDSALGDNPAPTDSQPLRDNPAPTDNPPLADNPAPTDSQPLGDNPAGKVPALTDNPAGAVRRYVLRPVGCDRLGRCRKLCAANGQPSVPCPPDWYVDRASCTANAEALVAELRAEGITNVIFSGMDTYRYVEHFAAAGGFHVIFDMHNVEAPLYRSIALATAGHPFWSTLMTEQNLRSVEAIEQAVVAAADELWTCSVEDAELVREAYGFTGPVRVVPNVLDLDGWTEPEAAPPVRVSFTGRMEYPPNCLAAGVLAREIAPRLLDLGCDIPVVLAGAQLTDLAPLIAGRHVPPTVELVSDPESTAGVIAGSIMAVPLALGSGSRFKILEAFALGAPVVSSAKGAEGLDLVDGVHFLAAETPDEFAKAIVRLVEDDQLRADLVAAGARLLRDRYSVAALRESLQPSGAC